MVGSHNRNVALGRGEFKHADRFRLSPGADNTGALSI